MKLPNVWPKQGPMLHQRCQILFAYSGPPLGGTVVRDDAEAPFEMLIRLDDGRFVRSVECQWRPL